MLHLDWRRQLKNLVTMGEGAGPRGFATRELLDEHLLIDSHYGLMDVPARGLNYRFAVAEWVWMMFGRSDVDSIAQFNSVVRNFSDDGVWLTGAYGPHIKAQRDRVLAKLREDPDTRQAVIEIPRPWNTFNTKDMPCTLSFQFLLRDGQLNLITSMRSSDVWLGLPYDVFTFTQLQNCMAGELGVKRGWFSLHMGSSHLYERDAIKAQAVLTHDPGTTLKMADLPGFPPEWLERVLLTRDHRAIPFDVDPKWLPYALSLIESTSEQALKILGGFK